MDRGYVLAQWASRTMRWVAVASAGGRPYTQRRQRRHRLSRREDAGAPFQQRREVLGRDAREIAHLECVQGSRMDPQFGGWVALTTQPETEGTTAGARRSRSGCHRRAR